MLTNLSTALFIIANLLIPISLLAFATGFFPYQTFLPGKATYDYSFVDNVELPIFDKVIFMVVDALRRLENRSQRRQGTSLSCLQRFRLLAPLGL